GYLYEVYLKDAKNALIYYTKALILTTKTNDVYTRASLYNNMGIVFGMNQEYDKALSHFQKGLMSLPIQFEAAESKINPTTDALKLVANDYIAMALLGNKGEAYLDQYKANKNITLLHHALQTFKRTDDMIQQMRWNQNREQSKLFWRQKTRKWYEKAIEVCYLLGDAQSAFYFLEKSRAVLLNDKLNELG